MPIPVFSAPAPPLNRLPITSRKAALDRFQPAVVPLKSDDGVGLLKDCEPDHLTALPRVMSHYEVSNATYQGGIASAVMVVNALGVSTRSLLEANEQEGAGRAISYATHDSLLTELARAEPMIGARGTTLDRLEALLDDCGLFAHASHVGSTDRAEVDRFRRRALASLKDPTSHVLVNFEFDGRGYHSPVAAYHRASDRFLIYNVAPPKPQPLWIKTEALVEAMATRDPDSGHPRGYLVARAENEPSQPLPKPPARPLISLDSQEGTALLQGCERQHLASLGGLMAEHQVQDRTLTCGTTSMGIVANDLDLPAPGFRLTESELEGLLPEAIRAQLAMPGVGLSLDNMELLAKRLGGETSRTSLRPLSEDTGQLDRFRRECLESLASPDSHIIVNYDRSVLGQEGGGHFSPIAAYNAQEDRFLIYDTAAYRYTPVWVPARNLYQAMATFDSELQGPRGYLKIRNPGLR